jgi:hypothetical protein
MNALRWSLGMVLLLLGLPITLVGLLLLEGSYRLQYGALLGREHFRAAVRRALDRMD